MSFAVGTFGTEDKKQILILSNAPDSPILINECTYTYMHTFVMCLDGSEPDKVDKMPFNDFRDTRSESQDIMKFYVISFVQERQIVDDLGGKARHFCCYH